MRVWRGSIRFRCQLSFSCLRTMCHQSTNLFTIKSSCNNSSSFSSVAQSLPIHLQKSSTEPTYYHQVLSQNGSAWLRLVRQLFFPYLHKQHANKLLLDAIQLHSPKQKKSKAILSLLFCCYCCCYFLWCLEIAQM